jgi:hypothetical protein
MLLRCWHEKSGSRSININHQGQRFKYSQATTCTEARKMAPFLRWNYLLIVGFITAGLAQGKAIVRQEQPYNDPQVPIEGDSSTSESPPTTLGTSAPNTSPSSSSECLSTSTGTHTWSMGVSGPNARYNPYGTKIEIDTFISPCETAYPMTVTQIQTIIASYIPEVSMDSGTTVNTFTWGHFAPSPTYAPSNNGGGISCGECPGEDWQSDPRCEELKYTTGCGIQCGFFRADYTCMLNSTREKEFKEGRICWDPNGTDVVYLGEPCHVGDSMAFCTPCKKYANPNLGGPMPWGR